MPTPAERAGQRPPVAQPRAELMKRMSTRDRFRAQQPLEGGYQWPEESDGGKAERGRSQAIPCTKISLL